MTTASASARWLGLDALRGLSIAAMILVNNPGRWGSAWQFGPLRHAAWHGCTFTDLVFPTFLFCAGVAIVPALARRLANGDPRAPIVGKIGRRVLALLLLGMFLSAFPLVTFAAGKELFAPLLGVRFPGVLQRIGVCYGIAALLLLFTAVRTQRLVLALCLLGYWPLITLVPIPDIGAPDIDVSGQTLQAWLDQAVFGGHIYRGWEGDPEGLLSTIPALGTCLLGVEAGRVLASPRSDRDKVRALLLGGIVAMLLGYAWSFALPFNKPIWTSSYAVWTAGIATIVLAALHRTAQTGPGPRLLRPLQIYGL
ncbi:MAG: DUF5009 domain-containing protein, partial [Planctomycetes bacterium]|nr:DUF5009 domain-containing protein [Planctomycetota bacterium]